MARMDDEALLRHLQASESTASQYLDTVSARRADSQQEYYRDPYPGDEELEGWSRIVTSEVQDTVEWVLPELLDIFTTSDEAVVFEPTKAEDVQGAAQATDACNYVFYKQNNGFLTLYTAIKDALISQNCAVMWRKVAEDVRDAQEAQGAPVEVLAMLEADGWEIEAAEPVMGAAVPLYNARLTKKRTRNRIVVEAFPPEELLVKSDWTSPLLAECPYVARAMRVTLSDLQQMGFRGVTAADLRSSEDPAPMDAQQTDREYRANGLPDDQSDLEDDSLATGWLRIEYVLVDYDGDGIAERRLIHRLEQKILSNEEADHVQIATASPILNTHRWDGLSLAQVVADIQRLKTDLTRNLVNASHLSVNPRKTVLTDANGAPYADMDDLLDFRLGGIIRHSREGAIGMEPVAFNGQHMLPVLAYVDDMAEKRTGVSKQQQGLDPNALRPDRTAAEVMMTANAAKQRIKLIARIFAETLVKPIFQGILKLLTSGEMEPLAFRLRGQFVQYDPQEWRDQYDMTINVGLGTGDKQQQIAQFQQLMALQMSLSQTPYGPLMIDPQKVYNAAAKVVELMGQKNVGDFIADPQGQQLPPPSPPPQIMVEQARIQSQMQLEQARLQAKAQADAAEREQQAQVEVLRQQAQQQTDAHRQQMEAEKHRMTLEHTAQLEALKAQYAEAGALREMEFDRWKAELDAATEIKAADMAGQTPTNDAATQAATDELGREIQP